MQLLAELEVYFIPEDGVGCGPQGQNLCASLQGSIGGGVTHKSSYATKCSHGSGAGIPIREECEGGGDGLRLPVQHSGLTDGHPRAEAGRVEVWGLEGPEGFQPVAF